MKIDRLEIFHIRMKLKHFFETSFGRTFHQEMILARLECGGVVGWGEAPVSDGPFYSYEYVGTAWDVMIRHLGPKMKEFGHPGDLPKLFKFVRGHNMAKAGLEMAAWDLLAKQRGKPLAQVYGATRTEIPAGISLGIEDKIDDLLKAVAAGLAKKYQRIKVKIKPGWDVEMLRAVRKEFPKIQLMADANAAYQRSDAPRLRTIDEFALTQIEQPLSFDDIVDHAEFARQLKTPICLDESITSPEIGQQAIRLGSCRIINIKPSRMGGPTNSIKMHDLAQAAGVPVWCGGMLESGVGRLHNIHLAALPNFSMPGDISAGERYWDEDIIDPPVTVTEKGTIPVPTRPGLGHDVIESRVERVTVRKQRIL